jgi:phosphatidylserine/phosphatidylglycerophosphate/cardiolipin synthase-like enzyme
VVSGGRNIADDYFGLAQDNWIDRDVAVTGWQAVKATDRYNKLWKDRLVKAIDPSKVSDAQLKEYNRNCTKWGPKEGNGMGNFHPLAWYQEYDGGRAFYTALGHLPATYSDANFMHHVYGGIYWAATGNGFTAQ